MFCELSPTSYYLSLNGNDVGDAGVELLSDALQVNGSLEVLE